MERRVVITGLGVVSPVGTGVEKFWNSLLEGKSGIAPITRFDAADFPVKIAGEVKDFDPALAGDKKQSDIWIAMPNLLLLLPGWQWKMPNWIWKRNPDMAGTVIGTGIGGIATMEETVFRIEQKGPGKVNPFAVPMMIANMASGQVSITFGLQGPVLTDVTACASGTNAIGLAARLIKHGDADVMIAGGTEAAVAKTPMAGFAAMKALSSRECPPEEASCPFDARRDGFVLGEGAGILVLEELEHAKKRGAYIYAELAGYGSNGDAYHITAPRPGGEVALRCMRKALADARIDPKDVDYINAHGTSTHLNDLNESTAIKALLGQHAYEIPVNSTKSMTGHLLGAAGAIEAVVCVLTIEKNRVHPTINRKEIDPDCDLDYVTDGARDVKVNVAMSNSFGFGGHNAVIVMRRYEE